MRDLHVGRIARVLRQRLGLRQVDVSERAGLGHDLVSRVERGRLDGLTIRSLRRVFEVFDAEVVVVVRWRGGELDRLVDRRHAVLAGRLAARLAGLGWEVVPEVSYSEFGERGSIDLLARHAETATLLVIEIKSELTSIEETVRRHDAKSRLGAKVARDRFGWVASSVARLLVLPDERTPRRHVARFADVLGRAYSSRGRAVSAWLAAPDGAISGLLFLSHADGARLRQRSGPVRRVSRPRTGPPAPKRPAPADVVGR